MTDYQFRLRVKLGSREFEVEGSEDFVEKHWADLQSLVDATEEVAEGGDAQSSSPLQNGTGSGPESLPDSFGEHLTRFGNLTDVDSILVAGDFQQTRSEDNLFTTREANQLLKEQGLKVGNASQCVAQNVKTKRIFKEGGKNRVSKGGKEHIEELLAEAKP